MKDIAPRASMTGFASTHGQSHNVTWTWDLRSVNGRGLEIKLRLPNGLDALEAPLREMAAGRLKRGNVSGSLSVKREAASTMMADPVALEVIKDLAIALADSIPGALPPRAELLLALPGVMRNVSAADDTLEMQEALAVAVSAGFVAALDGLIASRAAEGAKLSAVMDDLLGEITILVHDAQGKAALLPTTHKERLSAQLAELLGGTPALSEERLAQEVALLAAKSDVREELDRLTAHIQAARSHLAEQGAVGRKLDFLMQEFNREANTLCSKSASLPLTSIGLALKATIEQLREQVQNIE